MGDIIVVIPLVIFVIVLVIVIKSSDLFGNLFIKINIAIRNLRLHIKSTYKDLNVLNRDIDVEYSPAVLSYIYNTKLEPKKDVLSTILNLYNKKVITIEKEEKGYYFKPIENSNLSKLTPDEKYVYCAFVENEENKQLFSFEDWEKLVIQECETYNFINTKKYKLGSKPLILSLIIDIILMIIFGTKLIPLILPSGNNDSLISNIIIYGGLAILAGIMCSMPIASLCISLYDRILYVKQLLNKLNENGKIELVKWIKFKKFIKAYTLLKDREIEEIVIYEKYIPYAMALNINKEYNDEEIKDFVKFYMKLMNRGAGKYLYTDFISSQKQKSL